MVKVFGLTITCLHEWAFLAVCVKWSREDSVREWWSSCYGFVMRCRVGLFRYREQSFASPVFSRVPRRSDKYLSVKEMGECEVELMSQLRA